MTYLKRIPKFYGFRIYFLSTLLFYLLVLPFAGFLLLQNLPTILEKSGSLIKPDGTETIEKTLPPPKGSEKDTTGLVISANAGNNNILNIRVDNESQEITDQQNEMLSKSFAFLFKSLLVSFLLGFAFNYPFKRYFRRKRNMIKIPDKLFRFCKKYILVSPWINMAILSLAFISTLFYMIFLIYSAPAEYDFGTTLFIRFFFITLFSSLLTLLFVYFWEKHRVHIKYLDHLYSKEELRQRVFKVAKGKIKNRFWISSAMTTLLPLDRKSTRLNSSH